MVGTLIDDLYVDNLGKVNGVAFNNGVKPSEDSKSDCSVNRSGKVESEDVSGWVIECPGDSGLE